ncbi:pyridoxal phosphate-dependent transferase [Mycena olivaceomarginata]|nr:pyridoxal phosphate-dependent transferase [Mycena olivaceomarginata]
MAKYLAHLSFISPVLLHLVLLHHRSRSVIWKISPAILLQTLFASAIVYVYVATEKMIQIPNVMLTVMGASHTPPCQLVTDGTTVFDALYYVARDAMLAINHAGIRPDIMLLGKALSGGVYPMSAVLADKDVMLCIQPGEHGSTYGGNPLACAVVITALDILVEEDLSVHTARLGEAFRLSVLVLTSPYIETVRGLGLLNAVVIDEDTCNAARGQDVVGNKQRTAWQFCLLLKAMGVLAKTTHGNVSVSVSLGATATEDALLFSSLLLFARSVRFAPPLVIEEADLVKAVKIIGECLIDLERLDEIPGDD